MSITAEPRKLCCPVEGSALVRHTHGKLAIDACPQCRGLWFSGSVIDRLRDHPGFTALRDGISTPSGAHRVEDRRCPACPASRLSSVRVRGVELDRCGECGGVWFDPGELELIRQRSQAASDHLESTHRGQRTVARRLDSAAESILRWDLAGDLVVLVGEVGAAAAGAAVGVAKGLLEAVVGLTDWS